MCESSDDSASLGKPPFASKKGNPLDRVCAGGDYIPSLKTFDCVRATGSYASRESEEALKNEAQLIMLVGQVLQPSKKLMC